MNHLQIGSNDIERSVEFYRSYFHFRKCRVEGDIVFMKNPENFLLAIRKFPAPIELPPWFHMGVSLNQSKEVKDLYLRLKSDGVKFSRDLAEGDGWVAFYCYDPCGIVVEVSWDRPEVAS